MPPDLIRGWIPVRVKKTRQNKNLERNRDSIRWDCALGKNAALPSLDAALRAQATRLRSIDLLVGVNAPQPLLFDPAIKPVAGDAARASACVNLPVPYARMPRPSRPRARPLSSLQIANAEPPSTAPPCIRHRTAPDRHLAPDPGFLFWLGLLLERTESQEPKKLRR